MLFAEPNHFERESARRAHEVKLNAPRGTFSFAFEIVHARRGDVRGRKRNARIFEGHAQPLVGESAASRCCKQAAQSRKILCPEIRNKRLHQTSGHLLHDQTVLQLDHVAPSLKFSYGHRIRRQGFSAAFRIVTLWPAEQRDRGGPLACSTLHEESQGHAGDQPPEGGLPRVRSFRYGDRPSARPKRSIHAARVSKKAEGAHRTQTRAV